MSEESTKGRVIGFVALGALIVLVSFAFYSGRSEPTTTVTQAAAPRDAATPAAPAAEPEPPATLPTVPAGDLTREIPSYDRGATITAVASDVALSPQARLLAERFQCVCGCKDILATCSCDKTPGSRDMKQLLQRLVDEGRTPGEIRNEMIATYGSAVIP